MDNFNFDPVTGLLDINTFPSEPVSETAARQQFMTLFNQLKDYINNTVKTEVNAIKTPPAWTIPTLANNWANYGSPYATAGYYKDGTGVVHLKGMVKLGGIGVGIFTLPAGYRPLETQYFIVPANDAIGEIQIKGDGTVLAAYGSNVWMNLNGITFRAEQ